MVPAMFLLLGIVVVLVQDPWLVQQLALTLGNAVVAVTEENSRLFPGRKVSEQKVSISTGIINLAASRRRRGYSRCDA